MTQEIKRKIRMASLLMVGSIFASRILGFLREWVLAQTVGATAMTDVYLASFTIPDFLNYLLAAGALNISFIPILSQYVGGEREEVGRRIYQTISTCMCLVMVVLLVLAEIFAPTLAVWVAPGFNSEQMDTLVVLLRIILPAQFFFFWGGLANGVQQTHGRFIYSAVAPVLYNLGIISLGLLLFSKIGISGFSIGVLVGAFAGYGILQAVGLKNLGYPILPKIYIDAEIKTAFKKYLWMTAPIMLGFSLVVTDEWISKYFASSMQAGAVSWISFARTEMRIPIAIIGQAAGIASFPYLSKLWANRNHLEFSQTLTAEIQKIWALGPIAAILMWTHAEPITYFIYGGGRMTPSDIVIVAELLRWMALGVVFWILQILLARGFYATHTTWLPSLLGSLMTIIAVPLYYALSKKEGVQGLAISGSIAIAVYTSVLWVCLRRHIRKTYPDVSFKKLYQFFFFWSLSLGAMYGISRGLSQLQIYQQTRLSALLDTLLAIAVLGAIAFALLRTVYKKITVEPLF